MLAMIVPGFIALFSLVAIFLSFDGCAAYIKGIFAGGALAIPIYVCAFALSYMTGMLIHRGSDLFFKKILTNNPRNIQEAKINFIKDLTGRGGREARSDKPLMEEYYERFYVAMEYPLTKVPILEAQVAFIRSMFFVVIFGIAVCVFYTCKMFLKGSALVLWLSLIVILSVVSILCYFRMIRVQKSIHYCVYEDSHYMQIRMNAGCKKGRATASITANTNKNQ